MGAPPGDDPSPGASVLSHSFFPGLTPSPFPSRSGSPASPLPGSRSRQGSDASVTSSRISSHSSRSSLSSASNEKRSSTSSVSSIGSTTSFSETSSLGIGSKPGSPQSVTLPILNPPSSLLLDEMYQSGWVNRDGSLPASSDRPHGLPSRGSLSRTREPSPRLEHPHLGPHGRD